MLFSYNWLNDYLQYKVTPRDVAQLLTQHAFEVDSVEKKEGDWVLDIDILANRAADCLSHQGVAREVNAICAFLKSFQTQKAKANLFDHELKTVEAFFKSLSKQNGNVSVRVEHAQDCDVYHMVKLSEVTVSQSPQWLKERLEAVGFDSISNLVDISNYVMLDMGEPNHLFDARSIANNSFVVRRAKQGESLTILGGAQHNVLPEDLLIADEEKPLALAGIKGGEDSGIHEDTTSIFVEAAHFNRELIYRSAKRLGIQTDGARRWGAGVPVEFAHIGLWRVISLIQELCGATVQGFYSTHPQPSIAHKNHVTVRQDHINGLLGTSLEKETIYRALYELGFKAEQESGGVLKVHPPFWRLDVAIPEDLIEEIGRLHGFDELQASVPHVSLIEPLQDDKQAWRSFLKYYLVSQGFDETYNYTLTHNQPPTTNNKAVYLLNPISEKRDILRTSLTPGLLENVVLNQGHFSSMKLFEVGKIFTKTQNSIKEEEVLAGLVFHRKSRDIFREAKGYAQGLLEAAGFDHQDYEFREVNSTRVDIIIGEKAVGHVSIPIYTGLKVKGEVAVFEFALDEFVKDANNEREFETPPKYPAVERDLSLFVSSTTKAGGVIQIIHEIGKELIEDVDVFDMYQEQGSEQKGLAFHIIYRSKKKTLEDKEVNALHEQIEKALIKRFNVKIR